MYKFVVHDPHFLPHSGCDLEISLNLGEGLVIVGENGLGKTTLLQRFYQETTHSRIIVEQKALDYFYDRSLKEVKEILFEARKSSLDKEMFHTLFAELGLKEREERRLSTLSGGENQCLKLICALSQNVDVYFLDEPSQFLDTGRKTILSRTLESLKQKKKAILVVEHDLTWLPQGWSIHQLGDVDKNVKQVKTWTT